MQERLAVRIFDGSARFGKHRARIEQIEARCGEHLARFGVRRLLHGLRERIAEFRRTSSTRFHCKNFNIAAEV